MSNATKPARRTRVEQNIYSRSDGRYEVGFRDGSGRQRWRTVEGGITAARAMRDELVSARRRGEQTGDPRLRFGKAADAWLSGPVAALRPSTRASYTWAVESYLRPRFATQRLDRITADDMVTLAAELRAGGLSEGSARSVLDAYGRICKYARRRLGYHGPNPVADLLPSERPKAGPTTERVVWTHEQIEQTIAGAREPWRTLFVVVAVTGCRIGEALGLTWEDVDLADPEGAALAFRKQLSRDGAYVQTKTEGSARRVPIPAELAAILAAHKLAARVSAADAPVFATRTGRSLGHRNVTRALRAAMTRAATPEGLPTFPSLHERDERGRPVKPERGTLPSIHGFRHAYASRALAEGESVDEVAFLLGHANANVTRAVYVHEVADARREAQRRNRTSAAYGSVLEAHATTPALSDESASRTNVRTLRR